MIPATSNAWTHQRRRTLSVSCPRNNVKRLSPVCGEVCRTTRSPKLRFVSDHCLPALSGRTLDVTRKVWCGMFLRQQPHEKLNSCPDDPSVANGARRTDEELPLDLKAVEAELNALSPRSDTFSRDLLMFRAGQLSPRKEDDRHATPRRSWLWPTGFASMTATAAALLIMLVMRPEATVIEKVQIVRVPVAPPDTEDGRVALDATTAEIDSKPSQPRAVSPDPTADSLHDDICSWSCRRRVSVRSEPSYCPLAISQCLSRPPERRPR